MIIIPSSKRQKDLNIKNNISKNLISIENLPTKIFNNYQYYINSDTITPANELYTGTIMKEFYSLKPNDEMLSIAKQFVTFCSPLYGLINFDKNIHPYRLDYNCKIENESVISIWKNYYKTNLIDIDFVIDLTTKQCELFFLGNNVKRIEVTKSGLKLNHGKTLKGRLLFEILFNLSNNLTFDKDIIKKFDGLITIK